MQPVLFSKFLKEYDTRRLIKLAHELGIDGYDLCVRPGYIVNPDNAASALPALVKELASEGLVVPMVTGRGNLLNAADADVVPLLKAMDSADVRLLKLGYFHFDRQTEKSYWARVDEVRESLEVWQNAGRAHGVKICYHTHACCINGPVYMGSNASALAHLFRGFDPAAIGAYIDTGHLSLEGEPFDAAVAIIREYLSIVALKDACKVWDKQTNSPRLCWSKAGQGRVEWDLVFSELVRVDFNGPLSIHGEFETDNAEEFDTWLPQEVAFMLDGIAKARHAAKLKYAADGSLR